MNDLGMTGVNEITVTSTVAWKNTCYYRTQTIKDADPVETEFDLFIRGEKACSQKAKQEHQNARRNITEASQPQAILGIDGVTFTDNFH
ncbi:MAG: hypothetical protein AAF206_21115 [Bacteroidota bacterium]